jgi:alkanesulfonate monooxygenase SsuD/methylene tetrahydromethanopterin reductase-like flavin-dependent oxidoreductase (luciferase family)
MKVNWFHLMPYPYLPDDFKEKYRSVWVDVPSELYDPEKGHFVYNDYLDELEFAEDAGFDGLCVNEHHANAYGLMLCALCCMCLSGWINDHAAMRLGAGAFRGEAITLGKLMLQAAHLRFLR